MTWTVVLKDSVLDDLRYFGRSQGRALLGLAEELLQSDPLAETRNLKTLRPNKFAQRELRVQGKYRVLFNVNVQDEEVVILAVGEKHGNVLRVQGEEFKRHHESDSAE